MKQAHFPQLEIFLQRLIDQGYEFYVDLDNHNKVTRFYSDAFHRATFKEQKETILKDKIK